MCPFFITSLMTFHCILFVHPFDCIRFRPFKYDPSIEFTTLRYSVTNPSFCTIHFIPFVNPFMPIHIYSSFFQYFRRSFTIDPLFHTLRQSLRANSHPFVAISGNHSLSTLDLNRSRLYIYHLIKPFFCLFALNEK